MRKENSACSMPPVLSLSQPFGCKDRENDEYNKFFLKKFGIIRNSTYVPFWNKRIPHTIVRGILYDAEVDAEVPDPIVS